MIVEPNIPYRLLEKACLVYLGIILDDEERLKRWNDMRKSK
jgi:hypothetical protein